MKFSMKLASATAAVLALTAPVFAASHSEGETDDSAMSEDMSNETMAMGSGSDPRAENLIRTRDITGGNIYSVAMSESDWLETEYDGIDSAWEDIGEIEDVLLDEAGNMQGIVAEVGGFLDIADKHVFLSVDDVKLIPVDDMTYAYVTRYSEEELESMNGVDEGWWN